MDSFPTSTDYFSSDSGSQGSSSTVTPWTAAIPRSVPTLENMPFLDEDAMDAPPPYNYIHSPSEETERLLTKSSNSDDFLAVKKAAGPGKRSRFSEFFRWNPSVASKPENNDFTAPHGANLELPGCDLTHSTTQKDIWNMDQLQSAIQPVNPRLANLVPFLERSVWRTSSDEIARHVRTTSEEKLYKAQLAPIGTPFSAKPSTTTPQQIDLFQQIALSEQEIREILSKNWEAPTFNPLTGREVTWLMRLNPGNQPIPSGTTAADITQPATAHSRNVSTDSSRGSLSPEPSSSLIASASAEASSPATSTSTVAQAQAQAQANTQAQAKRTPSTLFTNAEAQAQQQREIEIATMKERRARETVLRPPPVPMPMPMGFVAPGSAPSPAPVSMLLQGSKLAPSTAAAAPFVPTVARMGIAGLCEGSLELGEEEWAGLLGRQILELSGALEIVSGDGSEVGL